MARIINNTGDLYIAIQNECYKAMEDAVNICLKKLKEFINEDVYHNKPQNPKFRTKWLLKIKEPEFKKVFTANIYKAFGKGIGANIKPNMNYDVGSYPPKFQHGAGYLTQNGDYHEYSSITDMKNYLELLNNPNFIKHKNHKVSHFGFPEEVDREPFWDDFEKWMDKNFDTVYGECLSKYVELRNIPYKGTRYMPK